MNLEAVGHIAENQTNRDLQYYEDLGTFFNQSSGPVQVGETAAPEAPDDLREAVRLYDLGRPINHIPRVELVVGDALQTMPEYVDQNQHLLVALLYLDFDLYDATHAAINAFRPRMPKGAVIAFDQLGMKQWPGETRAVVDALGVPNLQIRRFPWPPPDPVPCGDRDRSGAAAQ